MTDGWPAYDGINASRDGFMTQRVVAHQDGSERARGAGGAAVLPRHWTTTTAVNVIAFSHTHRAAVNHITTQFAVSARHVWRLIARVWPVTLTGPGGAISAQITTRHALTHTRAARYGYQGSNRRMHAQCASRWRDM